MKKTTKFHVNLIKETHMGSTRSRNPNNSASISRAGNYVIMAKPENMMHDTRTTEFSEGSILHQEELQTIVISLKIYIDHEFLNFGILSSFKESDVENLAATEQPLRKEVGKENEYLNPKNQKN